MLPIADPTNGFRQFFDSFFGDWQQVDYRHKRKSMDLMDCSGKGKMASCLTQSTELSSRIGN
jgi:hypothetical protein